MFVCVFACLFSVCLSELGECILQVCVCLFVFCLSELGGGMHLARN